MDSKSRKALLVSGGAMAAAGTVLSGAQPAAAASFIVSNLNDSGVGSLRQAILDANAAGGSDVIAFQAGLNGTIVLTSGQLAVSDSVEIQGPGAAVMTVSGNDSSRVFYLYNNASLINVTISGVTVSGGAASIGAGIVDFDENLVLDGVVLSGNDASDDGGGLWMDGFNFSATIVDSTITGNTAASSGGGVYNEDTGGLLSFVNSTISGNTAGSDGGGVYFYDPDHEVLFVDSTISGNSAVDAGGGLAVYDTDGGPFTIQRTTISGNTARVGGGAYFYGPDDPVVVSDSTISGNHATAAGGGLFAYEIYDGFTIEHSTIASNDTAANNGGGLAIVNDNVTLDHTIIADNIAAAPTTGADLVASPGNATVDANWSLIEDPTGYTINTGANNIEGVDPQLGPLQGNGGPTFTQAPAPTSAAVDSGDPAFIPPPTIDQRGASRVVNTVIDRGAVERVGAPANDAYSTPEDTPLIVAAPGLLSNDPDPASATANVATQPGHGTVVVNANGSFTYTPAGNYNGPDQFTYAASGPFRTTASATVNIVVNAVNDAPVAANDAASGADGAGAIPIAVLGNDADTDGDTLTVTGASQGANGSVTFTATGVTYTPNAGFSGSDAFTYTISDGALTSIATVNVTIAAAPTTTTTATTTTTTNSSTTTTEPITTSTVTPATTVAPTTVAPSTPPPVLTTPIIGQLPATGTDTNSSTTLAAGVLGSGVVLTAAARRRQKRLRRS